MPDAPDPCAICGAPPRFLVASFAGTSIRFVTACLACVESEELRERFGEEVELEPLR